MHVCADVGIYRCCFVHIYILPSMQIHKMHENELQARHQIQSSSLVSLSLLELCGAEAKFETGLNKHSCMEATEQNQMSMTSSLYASCNPFGLNLANTGGARQGLHALCTCTD